MRSTPAKRHRARSGVKSPSRPRPPSLLEETLVLHLRAEGIPYTREHAFHPGRKWRFDFCFPDHKVAVECEGGIRSNGRHVRPEGFIADVHKYNAAALLGWRVLRFSKAMIECGMAIGMIKQVLGRE